MFRRTIIIGIAALVLVSGQGYGQEPEQDSEASSAIEQEPAADDPVSVVIVTDPTETEASERREEKAADTQQRDLIAQQRMADATEAMNRATQSLMWAAWVSVFVGSIGVGALVWTFMAQRQIFQSQERAIIEVESAAFWPIMRHGTPSMHVDVLIKNTGRTHAKKVNMSAAVSWHPGEKYIPDHSPGISDLKFELQGQKLSEKASGFCPEIPPGEFDVIASVQETEIDISPIKDAHQKWGSGGPNIMGVGPNLTFSGEIVFEDVFGEKNSVSFAFSWYTVHGHAPYYTNTAGARHWRTRQYLREAEEHEAKRKKPKHDSQ